MSCHCPRWSTIQILTTHNVASVAHWVFFFFISLAFFYLNGVDVSWSCQSLLGRPIVYFISWYTSCPVSINAFIMYLILFAFFELQAFEIRPVVSRMMLCAMSNVSVKKTRLILPLIAYYFSTGPYRVMWIKMGYDPRTDKSSGIYQVLNFRVRNVLSKFFFHYYYFWHFYYYYYLIPWLAIKTLHYLYNLPMIIFCFQFHNWLGTTIFTYSRMMIAYLLDNINERNYLDWIWFILSLQVLVVTKLSQSVDQLYLGWQ